MHEHCEGDQRIAGHRAEYSRTLAWKSERALFSCLTYIKENGITTAPTFWLADGRWFCD